MYNEKERRALQDILVCFICEQPQVMDLLFNSIAKDDLEQFLDSVMNLTFSRSVTLKLVWYFMEMEFVKHSSVGSVEATNTLFRENGVASKLLKCYLQKVGQSFLQEVLRPIVVQICVRDQRSSYEIDPDRVDSEDERVHNRELLTAAVEHVLNVITSHAMVVKMPPGIRIIAAFFDKLSRQYCPDTNSDALIGGFLMLRYFNPAIMSPEVFGLLPPGKQCSPKARRNLVLIGKVLQNMSNGVLFSSAKEGYMVSMNPWLELNTPRLQRSYHEIVMAATSCSTNLIIDSDLCPVTAADLQYFHQALFATSDAVLAAIPEAVTRADTPQQAAAALQTALPALQNAADNALHRAHSAQPAHLRLERFAFAARDYGGFALPGGEYTALRIELGGAQGRNWFCVLYPALCLSGAQSDYPTKAENALVFGRYEVRWAVKDAVMQIINKK